MTDRCQLVEETLTDVTLQAARALANTSSEEYMWDDGMLFKCQLEPSGSEVKRLCLPISVREMHGTCPWQVSTFRVSGQQIAEVWIKATTQQMSVYSTRSGLPWICPDALDFRRICACSDRILCAQGCPRSEAISSYYHRFISSFAKVAHPLHALTYGAPFETK